MIKPVWNSVKTYDGCYLKFFKNMDLKGGVTACFDEFSQMISVKQAGKQFGHDYLIKEKNAIRCSEMEVREPLRNKGFGGLLHALSVILMKENGAKNIYLDSLAQAIRFHFRNGFRTSAGSEKNAAVNMQSVIKSNTPFVDLKKRAKDINFNLSLRNKNAIKEADKLYDLYLARVFENGISPEDAVFPGVLGMELKMKDAGKNAGHYNNILNSFGIDYTI